ncbi:Undecaprenyl-phosphate mannosyltransferase [anaerobic digester metagenome]
MKVNIVLPILNEERRLEKGCRTVVDYMEVHYPGQYQITIMDNGSTDRSEEIAMHLATQYPDIVQYRKLTEKGVGIAFRTAIRENTCDVIGYMDVDISTKIDHMVQVFDYFQNHQNAAILNGSRLSKGSVVIGKKLSRKFTSSGLKYLLKLIFGMKINDCICGFKFFRKETAEQLVSACSDEKGWFYCIEMLLRAERCGIPIYEIPVTFIDDPDTTVNTKKVILNYLKCIARLYRQLHSEARKG